MLLHVACSQVPGGSTIRSPRGTPDGVSGAEASVVCGDCARRTIARLRIFSVYSTASAVRARCTERMQAGTMVARATPTMAKAIPASTAVTPRAVRLDPTIRRILAGFDPKGVGLFVLVDGYK